MSWAWFWQDRDSFLAEENAHCTQNQNHYFIYIATHSCEKNVELLGITREHFKPSNVDLYSHKLMRMAMPASFVTYDLPFKSETQPPEESELDFHICSTISIDSFLSPGKLDWGFGFRYFKTLTHITQQLTCWGSRRAWKNIVFEQLNTVVVQFELGKKIGENQFLKQTPQFWQYDWLTLIFMFYYSVFENKLNRCKLFRTELRLRLRVRRFFRK